MVTPAANVPEYCALIIKSKLLSSDEVESLYKLWKEERPGGDERVDSFRRFLIAKRALTEYQAALLQRGRAEGFFLNGYKILDQIGKGQMGGVYKAVHRFGQIVALKILPASKAKNPHILGRFQREARLLTQLDHPNVVRAFQVGESGGVHFIVMEYLEGETLNEILARRQQLPLAEAARLMSQALDGLQHLHEKRMIHRDVKPANMMLVPVADGASLDSTWDATLKILDIGLGRELFDDNLPEGEIETQLTQEGSVLGTPDYLAPEQAKDARAADIRSDIYSVGCVLFHCLTGQPPFPDTNIMAQMLKHATEQPPPLRLFLRELPPGFQAVMDRFLAKRPEDRFPTPAEAAAALRGFVTGGSPALAAKMVPAYRDWLESESQLERPKELGDAPPAPTAAKASTAPAPALSPPINPATAPGPTLNPPVNPATAPAPALNPTVKPAPPRGTTAPAPAYAGVPLPTKPTAAPRLEPPPWPPSQPSALPSLNEVDVELVTVPEPLAVPILTPPPADAAIPSHRPVWPLDRRDWLMLATGAASVLAAVGLGYALAKLLRRKDPLEEEVRPETE
ncbi:MAG: protein kinase [Gemmataceae bacterium]|nr:protein kinase [Gemmata sp.]MDW8199169.1 protein kinase [Gemmataceae bacterium]